MKSALTVAFTTARQQPHIYWFLSSLYLQMKPGMEIHVIIMDLYRNTRKEPASIPIGMQKALASLRWEAPKPSVWQGPHRLTPQDAWDVSSGRNAVICLCKTEWLAFLDDRCVLLPGWLDHIDAAMKGNYALFGSYEKRHGLQVKDGRIIELGKLDGEDCRERETKNLMWDVPHDCDGTWSFGCNLVFPLEWALQINGYDESLCGGASSEDCPFGKMMQNNGFQIKYDYRFKVVQDRTPSELGTPMFRQDKGVSPNDKSHEIVRRLRDLKRAPNRFDIREMRASVQAGNPFPIPTEPTTDWWDGSKLSEYGLNQ